MRLRSPVHHTPDSDSSSEWIELTCAAGQTYQIEVHSAVGPGRHILHRGDSPNARVSR